MTNGILIYNVCPLYICKRMSTNASQTRTLNWRVMCSKACENMASLRANEQSGTTEISLKRSDQASRSNAAMGHVLHHGVLFAPLQNRSMTSRRRHDGDNHLHIRTTTLAKSSSSSLPPPSPSPSPKAGAPVICRSPHNRRSRATALPSAPVPVTS